MRTKFLLFVCVVSFLTLFGCAKQDSSKEETGGTAYPKKKDSTDVGSLEVGKSIPSATVRDENGTEINLKDAVKGKPTVLVFYRGGWCMYCNTHLTALKEIEPKLKELGCFLVAVSPDKPEKIKKSKEEGKLEYALYSDSKAEAIQAFGLGFKVDAETLEKYKSYNIDLVEASGEKHYILPHPAVYVIDGEGVVQFSHANPDYQKRLDPAKIVEAAQKVVSSKAPSETNASE